MSNGVVFLLALWGKEYIDHFFEFSLRTLLASGNIPAMSQEYACTFLFLTIEDNFADFKEHAEFKHLETYCKVEFIDISDLIFDGCYSTTLTLAYDRGMRSRGNHMCSIYFFYLVADYIVADGALRNLIRYMKEGYSGITTGNFLVIQERFVEILKKISGSIAFTPHELLARAFEHIHPISLGQTISQNLIHTAHANRLFWKVNDQVIVGRFYLRHMFCIKPEVDDYVIGASCDYSFIPELCPSGKVAHIQDSDDFCLIEMAPYDYDKTYIKEGPFTVEKLANHMAKWTTSLHRSNAHLPIVFHSIPLDGPPTATIEASGAFIQQVERLLPKTPQPVRGHIYWISALNSILNLLIHKSDKSVYFAHGTFGGLIGSQTFFPRFGREDDDRFLIDLYNVPLPFELTKGQKTRTFLRGVITRSRLNTSLPFVQWFDHYCLKRSLKKAFVPDAPCLLISFQPIEPLIDWLETFYPQNILYQYHELFKMRSPHELKEVFKGRRQVVIVARDLLFCELGDLVRRCALHLPQGSPISIYIRHEQSAPKKLFKRSLATFLADLNCGGIICEKKEFNYNFSQMYFRHVYQLFAHLSFSSGFNILSRFFGYLGLLFFSSLCLFGNFMSFIRVVPRKKSTSTALLFKLTKNE